MNKNRYLLLLLPCVFMACTTTQDESVESTDLDFTIEKDEDEVEQEPEKQVEQAPKETKKPTAFSSNRAVNQFVKSAIYEQKNGNLDRALALLERAYRIESGNAFVSSSLAEVHFDKGEIRQAEQWALRAQSLTSIKRLKAEMWRLVATCRSELGDSLGAQRALDRAVKFDRIED